MKALLAQSALALAAMLSTTTSQPAVEDDPHKPKRRTKGEKKRARKQRYLNRT